MFLSYIDAFGTTPGLLMNSKTKHRTNFGGSLALIMIILMLLCILFLGKELVYKESPSVNLSTEYIEHPDKLSYFGNYEFLFSLQNQDMMPKINESIYYVKAYLFRTVRTSEGEKTNERIEINITSCDKVITKEHKNYHLIQHFDLKNFYCISKEQTNVKFEDIYIVDFWGNVGFQMIQVKIFDCVNDTERTCASQEEIDAFIGYSTLTYYSFDTFILTSNYGSPFSSGLKEYFYYVSNTFFKAVTQYIRKVKITSYDGLIFSGKSEMISFRHDHMFDYDNIKRDPQTKNFISISVQLTNEQDGYIRKYYKIPDLLAQLGGIYKALFVVMVIISHYYNENSMYEELFNHFFQLIPFDDNIKGEECRTINGSSFYNEGNKVENIVNDDILSSDPETHPVEKKDEFLVKNKKVKVNLSFCEKLFLFNLCKCCPTRNNKRFLYFSGQKKICSYLETSNYLLKIHQVDMIKKVLSKNESIKHIYYLNTPVISLDEKNEKSNQLLPEEYRKRLYSG